MLFLSLSRQTPQRNHNRHLYIESFSAAGKMVTAQLTQVKSTLLLPCLVFVKLYFREKEVPLPHFGQSQAHVDQYNLSIREQKVSQEQRDTARHAGQSAP